MALIPTQERLLKLGIIVGRMEWSKRLLLYGNWKSMSKRRLRLATMEQMAMISLESRQRLT